MSDPRVVVGADNIARNYAQRLAASPEALAQWEAALIDVPPEVERHLRPLLKRKPSDYAGDSHLIGGDHEQLV